MGVEEEKKTTLRFSGEAKQKFYDISNNIESNMGPGGNYQYAKDHASKLPENIARLAALIHFFDKSSEQEISVDTLMEANGLMQYYSVQFMQVFCPSPKYLTDASNLYKWFSAYVNSNVRYIKQNKLLQYGPKGTRRKAHLEEALAYLITQNKISVFISGRTKVIDLFPAIQFDANKLQQDLLTDITLPVASTIW